MDTSLKGINEISTYKYKSRDSELEFVCNILIPDFILFTISTSATFILLMTLFGSTN